MPEYEFDYSDGRWYAFTLGVFIQILIDSGHDPAILIRVLDESRVNENSFIRRMEVIQIPDGAVVQQIKEKGEIPTHKLLSAFIEAGLIK